MVFSTAVLMQLASSSSHAQGKITAIERNLHGLKRTTEVSCIRHKTRRAEPAVTVPMDLELGDELRSNSGAVIVKVNCGKASSVVLSGPFRVRFLTSDNKDCSLYDYSKPGAQVIVKSSAPTAVRSGARGEIRLASKRTQYEISTARGARKTLTRQWIVYEGEVAVQTPRISTIVPQGQKLVTKGVAAHPVTAVATADIQQAANIYARIDVSQMLLPEEMGRKEVFLRLQPLHRALLTDPSNKQIQIHLASEQIQFGIPIASFDSPETSNPRVVSLTLVPDTQSQEVFSVDNGCLQPHKFRVAQLNLPFVRVLSPLESIVGGHGETKVNVGFDTTGMKDGDYQGELWFKCLDCFQEAGCFWARERLLVNVKIPAALIERLVKSPIQTPVEQKHLPKAFGTEPDVWALTLKPDTKTVLPLIRSNECKKDHWVNVEIVSTPFVRVVSPARIYAPGRGADHVWRLEFDASGMKPGNYRGVVVQSCLDCAEDKECGAPPRRTQINLTIEE